MGCLLTLSQAFGVQAISGTGSLRLGAEFLKAYHPSSVVYLPNPTWGKPLCIRAYESVVLLFTWLCGARLHMHSVLRRQTYISSIVCAGNHQGVFRGSGFTDMRRYRYWKQSSRGVDMEGLLEDLRGAPEHAVVVLHACAHNPTGSDPTKEEWCQILEVVKVR